MSAQQALYLTAHQVRIFGEAGLVTTAEDAQIYVTGTKMPIEVIRPFAPSISPIRTRVKPGCSPKHVEYDPTPMIPITNRRTHHA